MTATLMDILKIRTPSSGGIPSACTRWVGSGGTLSILHPIEVTSPKCYQHFVAHADNLNFTVVGSHFIICKKESPSKSIHTFASQLIDSARSSQCQP